MANYITTEEADTFIASNKLQRDSWNRATDGDKTIAITMATRAIDRLVYKNEKTSSTQENEFPRGSETSVPQDIKDACAELAFEFIDGRDRNIEFDSLTVQGSRFGPVTSTSKGKTNRQHIAAGIPSFEAWTLLIPYLVDISSMTVVRV